MSSTGVTFLQALADRYGAADETVYDDGAFLVGFGGKNAKNNKKWEMVGMEKTRKKQAAHAHISTVVLKDAGVTTAEAAPGDIAAEKMVRTTEVDLSGNVLLTEAAIDVIVRALPALQLVQLNRIPLLLREDGGEREGLLDKLVAEGRVEVRARPGVVVAEGAAPAVEVVGVVRPGLPACFEPPASTISTTSSVDGAVVPPLALRTLTFAWPNVRELVLNGTGLRSLLPLRGLRLPQCSSIHLDMNAIGALFGAPADEAAARADAAAAATVDLFQGLAAVTSLSAALNDLAAWTGPSGLHRLRRDAFPRLNALLVSGNGLPDLPEASEGDDEVAMLYEVLGGLQTVDISDSAAMACPQGTLAVLARRAPQLHALRLSYDALFNDKARYPTEATARNIVIAAIPQLQVLNRASVRPKERADAEMYYLQRAMTEFDLFAAEAAHNQTTQQQQQDQQTSATTTSTTSTTTAPVEAPPLLVPPPAVLTAYPQYSVLREKYRHAILAAARHASADGTTGGSFFTAEVLLRCDGNADVRKLLPASMTVAKLRLLAAAVFPPPPAAVGGSATATLTFWAGGGNVAPAPVSLSSDTQSIGFYGVCNGCIIQVQYPSSR